MVEFGRLETSVNSVKEMLQQVSEEKMNKDQTTLLESFKDASFQDFADCTWTRWLIITENSINEAE